MAKIIRTEVRKRGFFGHIFKWLFILFNILMLVWLVAGIANIGDLMNKTAGEAELAGAAIGSAIGVSMVIFIWMAGAIILGLFTILTRGKKTIVEEYEQ
jgi:hypothetical protein